MNFTALFAPIKIDIDTTRLVDGEYVLKAVGLSLARRHSAATIYGAQR